MSKIRTAILLTLIFVTVAAIACSYLAFPGRAIGMQIGPVEITLSLYETPRLGTHSDCGLDQCPVLALNFHSAPRLSERQANRAVFIDISSETAMADGSAHR